MESTKENKMKDFDNYDELTKFGKMLVNYLAKDLKIEAEDRGNHTVVKLKLRGKTISSCEITHGGAACY